MSRYGYFQTGTYKATHIQHNFSTEIGKFGIERGDYEKFAQHALFDNRYTVVLSKEDASLNVKQPDGYIDGKVMDIKGVEGNPMWAINRACVQNVEVCVLYFHDATAFSEDDVRKKFITDLPIWRNEQDFIHQKEMSVKTVICVVNKNDSYSIHEIKKPGE